MIIILCLVLALVFLVSKFVLGINFSLMEQDSYMAFGYSEVRGAQVWTLAFDSFTGSISAEGTFPEDSSRRLIIHSGTGNSELTLDVKCGKNTGSYTLYGTPLDLIVPGDDAKFTLTLRGTDVLTGYFNAVWE